MTAAARSVTPRLYLAIPATIEAAQLRDVSDTLAKADVAAVMLRLPDSDPRTLTERIKAFAPAVQASGAALLIDGHAELAARGGADGAHLTGIDAMQEARPSLQPQRIAGVGGLPTRHDAMLAGEAGVDYVLFGEPGRDGARPSIEAIAERVGWWAELFEIPCVGFAGSRDEASIIAAAGADFILVEGCIWSDSHGPAAALMDVAQAIGQGLARNAAESR